jgi:UDP-N-acetylglucosamine 2-epimerase (non-hydrolysing)
MLEQFGLGPPDIFLHRGGDVVSLPQMARWMLAVLAKCAVARRSIFGQEARGIVLVHGDTFSTLLGALMGRVAGLRVGHVESGLRSFRLFHPFPEEITRLLTFRLSHTLYCPGEWALENVARYRREKVNTEVNTLSDALALALRVARRTDHLPDERFALISLHRFENIFSHQRLEALITAVEELARDRLLLFILHPPTERQIQRFGLRQRLADNPRIELRPRYPYFDFVSLMERADFVVTDGGSIQEESSYTGVPCLLMREVTERREGLGANVVLSRFDPTVIRAFALDAESHRRPASSSATCASDIIIDSALQHAR